MTPEPVQERLELKDLAQDSLLLRDKGSVGRAFVERVFAMHGTAPWCPPWKA